MYSSTDGQAWSNAGWITLNTINYMLLGLGGASDWDNARSSSKSKAMKEGKRKLVIGFIISDTELNIIEWERRVGSFKSII